MRGGYGLYFDMMPIDLPASQTPFVFQETTFTNPATPTVVFPTVFPRPARQGRRPWRCRSPSIRICGFRTATSGTRRSSTSDGGPASALSYVATLGREMWFTRDINAPEA